VLAAALVVGVRGRVLPAADGARTEQATSPDVTETVPPRPSLHDALADSVTARGAGEADIEFGWSSRLRQRIPATTRSTGAPRSTNSARPAGTRHVAQEGYGDDPADRDRYAHKS
jgi:hypothetical protein